MLDAKSEPKYSKGGKTSESHGFDKKADKLMVNASTDRHIEGCFTVINPILRASGVL